MMTGCLTKKRAFINLKHAKKYPLLDFVIAVNIMYFQQIGDSLTPICIGAVYM